MMRMTVIILLMIKDELNTRREILAGVLHYL